VRDVYELNPLKDPRWPEFVQRQPRASVFHTSEWLEALRRTYGYEPVVYTTSAPSAELRHGIVFCQVRSWVTGQRLVSLPFSDHCEPLVDGPDGWQELCNAMVRERATHDWKYVEIRTRELEPARESQFQPGCQYLFHVLALNASEEELFRRFHKDSVQRKIRRAAREGLTYSEGRAEEHLCQFYRLQVMTRRRQRLPPQPVEWFRNVLACLGENAKIRIAFKDKQPVASILTLRFRETLVYKYGCSDARFSNLGGTALLFWKSIQEACQTGAAYFDMGRSDCENHGLATFKERWGGTRSTLTYWTYPVQQARLAFEAWTARTAKRMIFWLPDWALTATGKLLYKHIG
jgi:CelD/BcsL family acetyltransferase involved in cellulose biosynthesis